MKPPDSTAVKLMVAQFWLSGICGSAKKFHLRGEDHHYLMNIQ